MKVIKDNCNTISSATNHKNITIHYPRKWVCEHCASELEYEKEDVRVGALGCSYIDCPCCGHDILVEDEGEMTLTKHNVEFPTHFFYTSTETGAVDHCNNNNIKGYINQAIDYFRNHKGEFCWSACCGNLYIRVSRYEEGGEYWVVVSNNYYDTYIPFEKDDYSYDGCDSI